MIATQIGVNEYKGIPLDIFYWQSDKHGWMNVEVPPVAGIYIISAINTERIWLGFGSDPRILYVGQTNNLRKRRYHHEVITDLQYEYDVMRFSFMPIVYPTKDFLLDVEKFFIKLYKPDLNVIHNG